LTGTGLVPDRIETALPIVPELGGAVEAVIGGVLSAWDVPVHRAGIAAAAQAVTDELVTRSAAWSILGLSLERDDLDVYVRLSADLDPGAVPTLTGTTRARVALAATSHDIALEDGRLLVVLQAPCH
jgi:hypothetical protein